MKLSPSLLLAEAVVLGLPVTILFVGTLPILFIALFALLSAPSFEGAWFAIQLLCSCYALVRYWHLAIRTVRAEPISLGGSFWSGMACACIAAFFLVTWAGNTVPALLVVVVAAIAATHFVAIQRAMLASKTVAAPAK
jgi:hypothetical protein